MNTYRRRAVAALVAAGLLWGTTVPLSKLALEWLPPGWLAFARFGLAAAILLTAASRPAVRGACTPLMLASGAAGYGGSVVVQNAGITRTSVTHAALLIGAAPVLVAVIAALWQHTVARPVAWAGFALSLAGVGLVAGGQGGGATAAGDGLVLVSLLLSAGFTVAQARLLPGRDPVAVTAVQFLGAALAALLFSAATEGLPAVPHGPATVLATVALAAGGTLLPFTLFAYGQSRIPAEVAGAFLNLEPLVGAVAGIVVFADPVGPAQVTGGAAIIAGIALSTLPLLRAGRPRAPSGPAVSGRNEAPDQPVSAARPGNDDGHEASVDGGERWLLSRSSSFRASRWTSTRGCSRWAGRRSLISPTACITSATRRTQGSPSSMYGPTSSPSPPSVRSSARPRRRQAWRPSPPCMRCKGSSPRTASAVSDRIPRVARSRGRPDDAGPARSSGTNGPGARISAPRALPAPWR